MKQQTQNKKLIKKFYNYWTSFILLTVLVLLVRDSFFVNKFPNVLKQQQQKINDKILINKKIKQKNQSLLIELKAKSEANMEILESQARYRFGFIKNGEKYYQIDEHNPNKK